MIEEASNVIPAQSAFIENKENKDKQRHNMSQTMGYELGALGRASDVDHAMGSGSEDAEDPDEPRPLPRGRVLDNVLTVAKGIGKFAWTGTKLCVKGALATGRAFGKAARYLNFVDDRDVYAELRRAPSGSTPPSSMSRSSSAAPSAPRGAVRTASIPKEAPKRGRLTTPVKKSAGKIQEGIVGGDRVAKKIRDTARVFIRGRV
jgi:hypothetical protein